MRVVSGPVPHGDLRSLSLDSALCRLPLMGEMRRSLLRWIFCLFSGFGIWLGIYAFSLSSKYYFDKMHLEFECVGGIRNDRMRQSSLSHTAVMQHDPHESKQCLKW